MKLIEMTEIGTAQINFNIWLIDSQQQLREKFGILSTFVCDLSEADPRVVGLTILPTAMYEKAFDINQFIDTCMQEQSLESLGVLFTENCDSDAFKAMLLAPETLAEYVMEMITLNVAMAAKYYREDVAHAKS